ncbi:MAG: hypothetical protein ACI4DS_08255 [Eubacterium sp.]
MKKRAILKHLPLLAAVFVMCMAYKTDAYALTGSGTASNPYQVGSQTTLEDAIEAGASRSSSYIKLTKSFTLSETVTIKNGKTYLIYAPDDTTRVITRSKDLEGVMFDVQAKSTLKIGSTVSGRLGKVSINGNGWNSDSGIWKDLSGGTWGTLINATGDKTNITLQGSVDIYGGYNVDGAGGGAISVQNLSSLIINGTYSSSANQIRIYHNKGVNGGGTGISYGIYNRAWRFL